MSANKTIIFIHRRYFHQRPPVISVVEYLTQLGCKPHVITAGINPHFEETFKQKGITCSVIPFQVSNNIIFNAIKGFIWGIKARREVKKLAEGKDVVLWIEGNYTFDSLTTEFINKYPHVLQVQELPDILIPKGKYTMKTLGKIMPTAIANLTPEYNRAWILYCLLQLPVPPLVLPNKPAFIPTKEELQLLGEKFIEFNKTVGNRKIILYQGILSDGRNLESFVRAAKEFDQDKFVTVLLGEKTSLVDRYKEIDQNLIHIDFVPAPDYLYITSRAYMGIVSYDSTTLNRAYCAPNKIYEYGAFGVPMIGNDIPGLRYSIALSNCGVVCDDRSVESILNGMQQIHANYEAFSKNAHCLYDSLDNKATIKRVIHLINS